LSGLLAKFQGAYFDLLTAEFDAFSRMGKGFDEVSGNLTDTADAYEKSEHETTSRFTDLRTDTEGKLAHSSDTEGRLAGPGPVRVAAGAAEHPRRAAPVGPECPAGQKDYFKFGNATSYMPKMSYSDDLGMVEGLLVQAINMDVVGGLDNIIQNAFGFSPAKSLCTPLLGDWQILWVMRDAYADAANAVDAVGNLLRSRNTTFTNGAWTGAAAASFGQTIDSWRTVLGGHSNNLRMTSDLMVRWATGSTPTPRRSPLRWKARCRR
jgi:uncharacterized protein YukE